MVLSTPPHADHAGSQALIGASLYSGHPREMASLVPHQDRSVRSGHRESTWEISGEHWVGCAYRGTDTQLIQRVPIEAGTCRLSDSTARQAPQRLVFECTSR